MATIYSPPPLLPQQPASNADSQHMWVSAEARKAAILSPINTGMTATPPKSDGRIVGIPAEVYQNGIPPDVVDHNYYPPPGTKAETTEIISPAATPFYKNPVFIMVGGATLVAAVLMFTSMGSGSLSGLGRKRRKKRRSRR